MIFSGANVEACASTGSSSTSVSDIPDQDIGYGGDETKFNRFACWKQFPYFSIFIVSSGVVSLTVYIMGIALALSGVAGWVFIADASFFLIQSLFGFYAADRYSIRTLLGARKKIPMIYLKANIFITVLGFVFGIALIVFRHGSQGAEELGPGWFSISRGGCLILYSIVFHVFSWYLLICQMDIPNDGTIIPLVYTRCLCLPIPVYQIFFIVMPLVAIATVVSVLVANVNLKKDNLTGKCEFWLRFYILACVSLFGTYVIGASVSLFVAKLSIASRAITKGLLGFAAISSILIGLVGYILLESGDCSSEYSTLSGKNHHLILVLRGISLCFGFTLFLVSIFCRCESLIETPNFAER